jgi:hypothetical protein
MAIATVRLRPPRRRNDWEELAVVDVGMSGCGRSRRSHKTRVVRFAESSESRSRSMLAPRSLVRCHPIAAARKPWCNGSRRTCSLHRSATIASLPTTAMVHDVSSKGEDQVPPYRSSLRGRRSSPDKNKVPSKCSRFGASARQCWGFRTARYLAVSFHTFLIVKRLETPERGGVGRPRPSDDKFLVALRVARVPEAAAEASLVERVGKGASKRNCLTLGKICRPPGTAGFDRC